MKIYLDDVRPCPEGWTYCNWPSEVVELLKTENVTQLSLDHDLGDDIVTGKDVLIWLQEQVVIGKWNKKLPEITIHSDNPEGIRAMRLIIDSIKRHFKG